MLRVLDGVQLTIVVPTRNRADLAVAAVESVLEDAPAGVWVLISDNSTDAGDRDRLERFCRDRAHPALRYARPPEPLAMAAHWEWALHQVLDAGATHVGYLTDRMVFRPGEVTRLLELARMHPQRVITFNLDEVDDFASPVALLQQDWTGNLYEVDSARVLALAARGTLHGGLIPRMLNCVAPREVLEAVAVRFGALFDSIAPDFCFGFRCLATVPSVAYYDKSPLIHYASARSNGASYRRGVANDAQADFEANLGEHGLNHATPAPDIPTVGNAIFHEYCLVASQAPEVPPLVMQGYLGYLAREVPALQDTQLREHILKRLDELGWSPAMARREHLRFAGGLLPYVVQPYNFLRRALWQGRGSPALSALWRSADVVGVQPPVWLRLSDSKAALTYARSHPRRRARQPSDVRGLGWPFARRLATPAAAREAGPAVRRPEAAAGTPSAST
jgi:hypothetical protein